MATVTKTIPIQLDLNQKYAIRVRTINSFGVSSQWSESLLIQVSDAIESLPPPTGFDVVSGPNYLIVNWDLEIDGEISRYEIHAVAGSGNFFPSSSTLVGVVTQSNSFIFTSIKINGEWTQLSDGDLYTIRIRKINSAGDASAYTSPKQAVVGQDIESDFLQHTDIISAEEGIYPTVYVLSTQPVGAIPGDVWIQTEVEIPATPVTPPPLAPESLTVVDETTTGPTTAKLTWTSDWITVSSVKKIFVYRATGTNSNLLNSINKTNDQRLSQFLIPELTVTNPTNNYLLDPYSVDSTQVSYRIAGASRSDLTVPNGKLSDIARAPDNMRNGAPRPITSLSTVTTLTSVAVNFNRPIYWHDPGNPNYSYSVVNNVTNETVATGTFYDLSSSPSYLISGLESEVEHEVFIRAVDSAGKQSSAVSAVFTTDPPTPNVPTNLSQSNLTSSSVTLSWKVSGADALVNDHYEITRLSPGPVAIIADDIKGGTDISYNITGLTADVPYTFGVKAVDAEGVKSFNYAEITITTLEDSSPPPVPVINWFKPYYTGPTPTNNDYGKMYANITWYPDSEGGNTRFVVERRKNNGAWETAFDSTQEIVPSSPLLINATAYSAGDIVDIRVWSEDQHGNSNLSNAPTKSYTLIASPSYITATFTSNWNPKWGWNGTYYSSNPQLRYAPAQGYYSTQDSTYDMTGIWGYPQSGSTTISKFESLLKDKTIVSATIYLKTSGPTNYTILRDSSLIMHQNLVKPANAAAKPVRSSVTKEDSKLPYNSVREVSVPVSWIDSLKNGEWKGLGVFLAADKTRDVAHFYNVSGSTTFVDSKSGRVTIYHLG